MDLLKHTHICNMTFLRILIYHVRTKRLANQLQIQQSSSWPQDLVIDSMRKVRETRDLMRESFLRLNQQGAITKHPHPARIKRRCTSSIKVKICNGPWFTTPKFPTQITLSCLSSEYTIEVL